MRRALSRPAVGAAALYALLALVFVSPALVPGKTLSSSDALWSVPPWAESRPADVPELGANFELLDQALQFEPFMRFGREAFPDIALWNPHIMGGRPFAANAQSAPFSPFTAPAYAMPVEDALAWAAALKLFVAAFGAYLLARALRLRVAPSLLAGVVFGFGLFFVSWLAWPLASVWAWMPWLLALAEVALRRPGPLPAAGLSVVTAFQFFGGHPESSFHVLFAVVAFVALRLVVHRRAGAPEQRPLWRPLGAVAAGLAGGALLAGVALAPLAELILNSGELDERTSADPDRIRAVYLAMAFLPDFWGRPTGTLLPTTGFVNNRAFYAGALPLMLAVMAPVLRPTLTRVALAAFGLASAGVVVGAPPVHQVVNALPVFSTAHNGRMIIYYLLVVAVLAACALDDLLAPAAERPPRARWVKRVALAIAALPLAWLVAGRPGPSDVWPALEVAWGFADPPGEPDVIRLASLIVWVTFAAAAVALLAGRLRGRLAPAAFGTLAVGLVALDLFRIGMGLNPAIDEEHARLPVTGAIEHLRELRPARFVGASGLGTLPPLEPNTAMDFDLYDARGYDYPTVRRYSRLWERAVYGEEGFVIEQIEAPVTETSMRAFDLLSVAGVLAPAGGEQPRADGLRLAYEGPDANVYRNAGALPRAFVVGAGRVVEDDDQQLEAVLAPGFDGRSEAVLDEPVEGLGAPGRAGRARIAEYGRERVVVEARADRPGLLVLTDVHFPGWTAEVDGEEVPVERVNYLLRGVALPAGEHRVEFRYEPASWRVGWIASLVALLALIAVVAVSTASRRNGARGRGRAGEGEAPGRP